MTETLESFLRILCKSVNQGQQNAQQTLYLLTDNKDAKLAYDLLLTSGLEAKYFAEESGSKLYVRNQSLAACEDKIPALFATATLLRKLKDVLDQDPLADYTLSFSNSSAGRQFTMLLPAVKTSVARLENKPPESAQSASPKQVRPKLPSEPVEDTMLAGPAVARTAIPKSFKTSATDEDPLSKRLFFLLSGKAFTGGAWAIFAAIILGVVFSLLVMIKGFLCPDVATDARTIPSYCPQKAAPKGQI